MEAAKHRDFADGLMKRFPIRCVSAFVLWLLFLLLTFACSSWHVLSVHSEGEALLSARAVTCSEQIAALLATPSWNLDSVVARSVVFSSMRNRELYGVKVLKGDELLEGQRRGPTGELEPWDDVFIERTVQAISPITVDGENIGIVEVYLRSGPTLSFLESMTTLELVCFTLYSLFSTTCLFLYLLSRGDLPQLLESIQKLAAWCVQKVRNIQKKDTHDAVEPDPFAPKPEGTEPLVDLKAGRQYQGAYERAGFVTAELFHQVFHSAPDVMLRFVAEKNAEGLIHIAMLLEQSAPCIGAFDLQKKALRLQEAITFSPEEVFCLEVEACIQSLEQVLASLHA